MVPLKILQLSRIRSVSDARRFATEWSDFPLRNNCGQDIATILNPIWNNQEPEFYFHLSEMLGCDWACTIGMAANDNELIIVRRNGRPQFFWLGGLDIYCAATSARALYAGSEPKQQEIYTLPNSWCKEYQQLVARREDGLFECGYLLYGSKTANPHLMTSALLYPMKARDCSHELVSILCRNGVDVVCLNLSTKPEDQSAIQTIRTTSDQYNRTLAILAHIREPRNHQELESHAKFIKTNNIEIISGTSIDYLKEMRRLLTSLGANKVTVMFQIESTSALNSFNAALKEFDGIIYAIEHEEHPTVAPTICCSKKALIEKCNGVGKPIVIAEAFGSMEHSPRPSRFETNQLARAVFACCDGIMISAQASASANSRRVDAITRLAAQVCQQAEEDNYSHWDSFPYPHPRNLAQEFCYRMVWEASDTDAKLIILWFGLAELAKTLSTYHPHCPVLLLTQPGCNRELLIRRSIVLYETTEGENEDEVWPGVFAHAYCLGLLGQQDTVLAIRDTSMFAVVDAPALYDATTFSPFADTEW